MPGFRNVSTAVFGGMLAASLIGIFVIPMLYVTFQAWRERLRPGARPAKDLAPAEAPAATQHGH